MTKERGITLKTSKYTRILKSKHEGTLIYMWYDQIIIIHGNYAKEFKSLLWKYIYSPSYVCISANFPDL